MLHRALSTTFQEGHQQTIVNPEETTTKWINNLELKTLPFTVCIFERISLVC